MAVDSYYPGDSSEAEWFGSIKPKTNGFNYVTAGGKVLGWSTGEMGKALEAFDRLPEEERRPKIERPRDPAPGKRMLPAPPEGALIADVYCAYLERDAKGGLSRAPKYFERDSGRTLEPALTRNDTFWMTPEEWKSLLPEAPEAGRKFPAPDFFRKRLFELYLDDAAGRYRNATRAGELTLTVEKASPAGVDLRLDGFVQSGHPYDPANSKLHGSEFRLLGFLGYDAAQKAFTRFDIAAAGETWGEGEGEYGKYAYQCRGKEHRRYPIGIAFERVAPRRPADRVAPLRACHPFGGSESFKRYFGMSR